MQLAGSRITRARSDADDRLIVAEEPLASLQRRCGGEVPGIIAVPALLELVRKARMFGLRLARTFKAQDAHETIVAWVEVAPSDREEGGCDIKLANWRSIPVAVDDLAGAISRSAAIDRQLAELFVHLDAQQNILSVEGGAFDLAHAVEQMREGRGRPWTDFVELQGNHHRQPLHWRLLDGVAVRFEGSDRNWKACLSPISGMDNATAGFELCFVAEEPPVDSRPIAAVGAGQPLPGAAIGREIAPVLRQPIARIIANAETIRTRLAGPLADEYSAYASDIATAGEHLLALIEDLTDLEVVEAEEFTTAPDLIDLADVARRAAGILSVRAQERGIVIDAPDHDESLPAIGEFRRVLQVLLNLIGNAIRYSPEDTQIWLRLDSAKGKARITVADQGHGLDPAQQAAIFEKFERLGRSGDGGSGLGLYISRKLARAMGGELDVESAPGQGARFTLTLPAAE